LGRGTGRPFLQKGPPRKLYQKLAGFETISRVARVRIDHPDNSGSQHSLLPAFDLDGMLGALAKWLRILGFDASYPCRTPSSGRVFVTTKQVPGRLDTIIVDERDSLAQLRQVLEQAEVAPDPDLFLNRCLICNIPVEKISRDKAAGRVPEQVLQVVSMFNECPKCGRVYWEGSHSERIKRRLQKARLTFDTNVQSEK
jgi:uncharacterized protein